MIVSIFLTILVFILNLIMIRLINKGKANLLVRFIYAFFVFCISILSAYFLNLHAIIHVPDSKLGTYIEGEAITLGFAFPMLLSAFQFYYAIKRNILLISQQTSIKNSSEILNNLNGLFRGFFLYGSLMLNMSIFILVLIVTVGKKSLWFILLIFEPFVAIYFIVKIAQRVTERIEQVFEKKSEHHRTSIHVKKKKEVE